MRLTIKPFFLIAVTLVACAAMPASALATKVQGFETGEPAVTSIGDAGKVGTFQGQAAPEGSMQFLLTTIGSMSNEDTLTSQSSVFAVGNMALQTFFNGVGISGFEGSGVKIPFTLTAGLTELTFQYDFLSNEPFQSMPRADFAFAAIFNASNALEGSPNTFAVASVSMLSNPFGTQSPFQFHTGLQTQTLSVASLAPGNYTLGIGVADAGNADHASGILIDNVAVVPEPSVLALTVAGAGLMLGLRRRIKRS